MILSGKIMVVCGSHCKRQRSNVHSPEHSSLSLCLSLSLSLSLSVSLSLFPLSLTTHIHPQVAFPLRVMIMWLTELLVWVQEVTSIQFQFASWWIMPALHTCTLKRMALTIRQAPLSPKVSLTFHTHVVSFHQVIPQEVPPNVLHRSAAITPPSTRQPALQLAC